MPRPKKSSAQKPTLRNPWGGSPFEPNAKKSGKRMSELNCVSQSVFVGDNLPIMRGLNSGIADLIATDPPFNKERRFNHSFGTPAKTKSGKTKPGFDDAWTLDDVKAEEHELINSQYPDIYHLCSLARKMHSEGMMAYLIMMSARLLECHRLLKETGSMYLHCDHSANAYLRMLMDCIFKPKNFRNEIVWSYGKVSNAAAKKFLRAHDNILFYAKNIKLAKFNPQFETRLSTRKQQLVEVGYNTKNMNGQRYLYIYDEAKVNAKIKSGKIKLSEFDIVRNVDTTRGNALTDVLEIDHLNSQAKEKTGWVTQKPWALYERMILASSDEGDLVLDPFCGCTTTLAAAEGNGRKWIGIDRDPTVEAIVAQQLGRRTGQTLDFWSKQVIIRKCFAPHNQWPERTDLGKIPHYKKHFHELYTKQGGVCPGCNWHRDAHVMTVDHDFPRARGGKDNIGNLKVLCSGCNSTKGDRLTLAQLIAKNKKKGVWNDGKFGGNLIL